MIIPAAPIVPSDENSGRAPELAAGPLVDAIHSPLHPLPDTGRRMLAQFNGRARRIKPSDVGQLARSDVRVELCGEGDMGAAFKGDDLAKVIMLRAISAPTQAGRGEAGRQ